MTDKVKVIITVSKEEREWIHTLAKKSRSSIPFMVIELLDGKSKLYGIPIPEHPKRIRSYTQDLNRSVTARQKYMEKIDKELGL